MSRGPNSFEKRKREILKQRKRREKQERRLQRNAEKRLTKDQEHPRHGGPVEPEPAEERAPGPGNDDPP